MTDPPDTTNSPDETDPPDTTNPPDETDPPDTTNPPGETDPPDTTNPPGETDPPDTMNPPGETDPPDTTNPPGETGSNIDSDGDLQSDFAERTCGSDPDDPDSLSPDADGDNLPDCFRGYPVLPVVGEPGQSVDCMETLPCTWVSEDGAIEAKLLFADGVFRSNNSARGVGTTLSTVLEVTSNRDATITFLRDAEARGEDDAGFTGEVRETPLNGPFGSESRGPREVDVLAGIPIRVRETFNEDLEKESSLSELTLPFADGPTRTAARFLDVPTGRAPSVDKDCAGTLPCTWVSADGKKSMTIDSVRINFDDELEVGFTFVTNGEDREYVLNGDNSLASGDSFVDYELERLTFGDRSDLYNVSSPTPTGEAVPGTLQSIRQAARSDETLQSLTRLRVQLYASRLTVPFLDPVFRNLPVAR